jgi:type IV conjugative transfer system coupling protein TraD
MKSKYKESNTSNWIRGGQVIAHNVRMAKQVSWYVLIISVIFIILFTVYFGTANTKSYDRYITYKYLISSTYYSFGIKDGKVSFDLPSGRSIMLKHRQLVSNKFKNKANNVFSVYFDGFLYSLIGSIFIFLIVNWYIRRQGREQQSDKFLRGGALVSNDLLKNLIKDKINPNISFGKVPLIQGTETQHIEVSGSPGTSKSSGIKHFINDIRKQNDRAIIFSTSYEFIEEFYNKDKDIILNPFDDRFPNWNPWLECEEIYHYEDMAHSLIPEPDGENKADPFWDNGARIMLANSLRKLKESDNYSTSLLLKKLLQVKPIEIAELLKDTEAAALVATERGSVKTTESIRSILATYVGCLKFLRDSNDGFSIRKWVKDEAKNKGGCIFITASGEQRKAIKPLISCWIEVFAQSILSLPEDRNRRIYFIVDEMASLNKLSFLRNLLGESRKYGLSALISFLSYSHLEEIYGIRGAEALTSLTATKIFLRSNNMKNARWASTELGREEIKAVNKNLGVGAHKMRDSVSISQTDKTKELVLPTEIMNLDDLHGYYRLPGSYPVASFKQEIFAGNANSPGFVKSTHTDHIYMNSAKKIEDKNQSIINSVFGDGFDTFTGEMQDSNISTDKMEKEPC